MADLNQNNVTPELKPEDPKYIEEMAKLGEASLNAGNTHQTEVTPEIPAKPEGIPDKFYNAETGVVDYVGLAKSYQELEKKIGTKKTEDAPPKEKDDAPTAKADDATKAVEKAGLDMDSLRQEFTENGTISEASYEALEKAGISKETVDAHIAGQQALVAQVRQQAFDLTGGVDNYQAMVAWATQELSPEEISAFNSQVNTLNTGIRETAILGLYARYTRENGSGGDLASGKTSSASNSIQGYASTAEMQVAMSDPRYKKDPAYRKLVEEKVGKSKF